MGIVPLTVVDTLPIGTGCPRSRLMKLRAELEIRERF
jgi:hypothetical protein